LVRHRRIDLPLRSYGIGGHFILTA
jgi:hypothetical protein